MSERPSLADDVARLRHVLRRQNRPTVVAGHSYGGQIVTALGDDAPNVVGLVYIAAFGPDEGESLGALAMLSHAAEVLRLIETAGGAVAGDGAPDRLGRSSPR